MSNGLSVLVPSYNRAAYIERRLQSIYSQKFPGEFEVIWLDDASTDNSVAQVRAHPEFGKTLRLVQNTKNSGSPFKQWQKGLQEARFPFVWIAEDDDDCQADFVEVVMRPLEMNSEVVVSYCQSRLINENGKVDRLLMSGPDSRLFARWQKDYLHSGADELIDLIVVGTLRNASAVIFRRDTALPFPPQAAESRYHGDLVFWTQLLMRGKVAYTAQPLSDFRRHESATTHRLSGKASFEGALPWYRQVIALAATDPRIRPALQSRVQRDFERWINFIPLSELIKLDIPRLGSGISRMGLSTSQLKKAHVKALFKRMKEKLSQPVNRKMA